MCIVYMCIAYIDFFSENPLCLRLWDDLFTVYSLEREMSKSTVWLPYWYTFIEGIKETWRYIILDWVIWFSLIASFISVVSNSKGKYWFSRSLKTFITHVCCLVHCGFCMNKKLFCYNKHGGSVITSQDTGIMSKNLSYWQKSITLNLFVFSGDPFSLRIKINY